MLSITGPKPDQRRPDDQRLLLGVSIAGLLVWGIELSIKVVSYGPAYVSDGWRCVQFLAYFSLLIDVLGYPGVAFIYIRAMEVTRNLDLCLQAVQDPKVSSRRPIEMIARMMKSSHRMIRTVFLALASLPPAFCMLTFFVIMQVHALSSHLRAFDMSVPSSQLASDLLPGLVFCTAGAAWALVLW